MKKRIRSLALLLALAVWMGGILPIRAEEKVYQTEEVTTLYVNEPVRLKSSAGQKEKALQTSPYQGDAKALYRLLEERVMEAMLAGESRVDISDLHILVHDTKYQVEYLDCYSPYLTELSSYRVPYYDGEEPYYAYIDFENSMSIEETVAYFNRVDEALAVLNEVVETGTSEVEKALALHDYMVLYYEYDQERLENGTMPMQSYRSGGILLNRIGVCQAYAFLYMYVLQSYDIESRVVISNKMGHAWNYVKIDGIYYHTDVTWDDPVPDQFGAVQHSNFLLNDEEIQAEGHTSWNEVGITCDTSYPDAYWKEVCSPIYMENGKRYYIRDFSVLEKDRKTGVEQELYHLPFWLVYGSYSYYSAYAFSGLVLEDGNLYFNIPEKIYKIHLQTKEEEVVATCPQELEGYFYGMRKAGDHLECQVRKSLDDEGSIYQCLQVVFAEKGYFVKGTTGDVNQDEVTNLKDYMHMQKYLKKQIRQSAMAKDSDLTGDGLVDREDLKVLYRMICEL